MTEPTVPTAEATPPENSDSGDSTAAQPTMIDGVIPPVLPRRSIPERSTPNQPKPKPEPELESEPKENSDESNGQASSLVEEIARKLNIAMPSNDELSSEMEMIENTSNQGDSMFMDMLKQAGFGDLMEENKNVKYEDTIGDL